MKNFLLMMLVQQLNLWSDFFASKDENNTGNDDYIAGLLRETAKRISEYMNNPVG